LLNLAESLCPPSLGHIAVCEALFQVTGAPQWQDLAAQNVNTSDEFVRGRALWALVCTSSPQSSRQIYDLFVAWLSGSKDEELRSTAARGLMQILESPPLLEDQSAERIVLERKLFAADRGSLDAVLIEVGEALLRR